MSTTVFPITSPSIVIAGQWFSGWANAVSGRLSLNRWGNYSGFDVTATGTDLTLMMSMSNNGGTMTVSVLDGGAATTLTNQAC